MIANTDKIYIDGVWVSSTSTETISVQDPATMEEIARIPSGTAQDVDRAVAAARKAQVSWSRSALKERTELLQSILSSYRRRFDDFADVMRAEIGTPVRQARDVQAFLGIAHLEKLLEVLPEYPFEERKGSTLIMRDPIGVCGLITPWNVPINQIATKVYPAIAAGCASVLKPSEVAPLNAILFAEVLHDAGVPAGVFNLVHGLGDPVGERISSHPDISMVSFTGSTRAGIAVARSAASTVKRVAQELGGKSANILLDDTAFPEAVRKGVLSCMSNSGQACSSPTRMLVPEHRLAEVCEIAGETARSIQVGDPRLETTDMGPVVSQAQYERVQAMIEKGIAEGARVVAGGPGRPDGLDADVSGGCFVRPTVFADVTPSMTIAREEIFGPVLSILTYRDEDEAVAIANQTVYGLAAYVQSGDIRRARAVARRLEAGRVHINYPDLDRLAPFGGFKQSGNGRENGKYGIDEFVELKALIGHG
jgi:aldehyde dehydrogenase (NAD+)